jgi:hypothetical protein
LKKLNLLGKIFTRLTVLEEVETLNNRVKWKCVCICGNLIITSTNNLKRGNCKSCGCLKKEKIKNLNLLNPGEAAFNYLYSIYARNAKQRKYAFKLTQTQFKELTSSNCHYCNRVPQQKVKPHKGNNGYYIYNGIDRKDNNKGYNKINCVPCCKKCNRAKDDMSYKEFLNLIKDIYENTKDFKR